MSNTSNFALRMPPEFKEAAKALTNRIAFDVPIAEEPGYFRVKRLSSINDALVYLMHAGLRQTLEYLEKAITEKTEELNVSQEFMTFFMAHPAAQELRPANLPEDSPGRKWLEQYIAENEAERNDFMESEMAELASPSFANRDLSVMTRREAASDYSSTQERVFRLVEAKGAIQRALSAKGA